MSRMIDALEASGLGSAARRRVTHARSSSSHPAARGLKPKLVPVAKRLVGQMVEDIPERDLEITRATAAAHLLEPGRVGRFLS